MYTRGTDESVKRAMVFDASGKPINEVERLGERSSVSAERLVRLSTNGMERSKLTPLLGDKRDDGMVKLSERCHYARDKWAGGR